jgi:hypothetical protein
MAVPSYTEDLTDITLAESVTNWARVGIAGNPAVGADFSTQGTLCVDKQVSNGDGGLQFNFGSAITLGAGAHIWTWHFTATPGITQTIANKGAYILVGSGAAAYCQYHIAGSDTFGAGGRVARCYPVNYSVRTANASAPFRTLVGTPAANPQYFGGGMVTIATARTNLGIDAIRHGTGAYLTAGELIAAGDGTDNPCTFAGFQAQNDAVANRWGILTLVGGQYELQGTFAIGQNNAGVATLCRFQDSNKTIVIVDTIHAAADFTKIIVDHASTRCNWTNVNISTLGTTNPGQFTVTANNPIVNITGGTWANFGATTLRSNTTVNGTTFRECGQITQNSAVITNALVASSSAAVAVLSNNPSNITNTTFISDGTGHAIQLTATGTYDFTNLEFSGYATTNGSTGNEVLYNNSGGAVTINASGVTGIVSIRNGAGASTTVNNTVNITISGLKDNTEVRVYSSEDNSPPYSTPVELAGTDNATTGTTDNRSFSFNATPSNTVYIRVFNTNWIADDVTYVVPATSTAIQIPQRRDRVYNNP